MELSENLVEKLTPEKSADNDAEASRVKVLEAIATVCMNQRQYHLATKKYTQAGNRIKVSYSACTAYYYTRAIIPAFMQFDSYYKCLFW